MTATQIAGIVGMVGSASYLVGDVLMLAPGVGPRENPTRRFDFTTLAEYRRRAELFGTLAAMPPSRLAIGALLGVFATPLVLGGVWLAYRALEPAGPSYAVPVGVLLAVASIVGGPVHAAFTPLGELLSLLGAAPDEVRPLVLERVHRQIRWLKVSYGVVFLAAIVGAIWFSVGVATGRSALPTWMAAFNPVTLTNAWLLLKRFLPDAVTRYLEGAGFNIAYLVFFALLTGQLWSLV